jgi:hypothetical protein
LDELYRIGEKSALQAFDDYQTPGKTSRSRMNHGDLNKNSRTFID